MLRTASRKFAIGLAAWLLVARVLPAGLGAAAKWACYAVTDPKSRNFRIALCQEF